MQALTPHHHQQYQSQPFRSLNSRTPTYHNQSLPSQSASKLQQQAFPYNMNPRTPQPNMFRNNQTLNTNIHSNQRQSRGLSFQPPQIQVLDQYVMPSASPNFGYDPRRPNRKGQYMNNYDLNFDVMQQRVHCVICSQSYLSSQIHEHISKHKRKRDENAPILKEALKNYEAEDKPKAPIIVEPEEFNIQYNPNKYVLDYKTDYQTPLQDQPIYRDQCVGTQGLQPIKRARQQIAKEANLQKTDIKSAEILEPRQQHSHRQNIRLSDGQEQTISRGEYSRYNNERRPRGSIMGQELNKSVNRPKSAYQRQQVDLMGDEQRISTQDYNRYKNQRRPAHSIMGGPIPTIPQQNPLESQIPHYQNYDNLANNQQRMNNPHISSNRSKFRQNSSHSSKSSKHSKQRQSEYPQHDSITHKNRDHSNTSKKSSSVHQSNKNSGVYENNQRFSRNSYREDSQIEPSWHQNSMQNRQTIQQRQNNSYLDPDDRTQNQSRVYMREDNYQHNFNQGSFRQSSAISRNYNQNDYNQGTKNLNNDFNQSNISSIRLNEHDYDQSNMDRSNSNLYRSSAVSRNYNANDYNSGNRLNVSKTQRSYPHQSINFDQDDFNHQNLSQPKNDLYRSSAVSRNYNANDYNRGSHLNASQIQRSNQNQSINLSQDGYDESYMNQSNNNFYRQSAMSRNYNANDYNSGSHLNPRDTQRIDPNQSINISQHQYDQSQMGNSTKNFYKQSAMSRNYNANDVNYSQNQYNSGSHLNPRDTRRIDPNQSINISQHQYNQMSSPNANFYKQSAMSRNYNANDYNSGNYLNASNQRSKSHESIRLNQSDYEQSQLNHPNANLYRQSAMSRNYNTNDYNRVSNNQQLGPEYDLVHSKVTPLRFDENDYERSNYNNMNKKQLYHSSAMSRNYNANNYNNQSAMNFNSQPLPLYTSKNSSIHISDSDHFEPVNNQTNRDFYRQSAMNRTYNASDYQKKAPYQSAIYNNEKQFISFGANDYDSSNIPQNSRNMYQQSSVPRNYNSTNYNQPKTYPSNQESNKINLADEKGMEQSMPAPAFYKSSSITERHYDTGDYNKKSERQIYDEKLQNQVIDFNDGRERQEIMDSRKLINSSAKKRQFERTDSIQRSQDNQPFMTTVHPPKQSGIRSNKPPSIQENVDERNLESQFGSSHNQNKQYGGSELKIDERGRSRQDQRQMENRENKEGENNENNKKKKLPKFISSLWK